MARVRTELVAAAWVVAVGMASLAGPAFGAAGGGSSGFGGGGGRGGGGGFGGGGGTHGAGGGGVGAVFLLAIVLFFAVALIVGGISAARYRRRRRERVERVRLAAAEAAEDDPAFASEAVRQRAERLFREAQAAWDARDRARLGELVGPDLLVEWKRRLDDFDVKGWRNRVALIGSPRIEYVGLVNREGDDEDRAVVRIEASLEDYVVDQNGNTVTRRGSSSGTTTLCEYWTLAKRGEGWVVASIEQRAEGDHHLDEAIVASPWSDERIRDQAIVETAVADKLPPDFKPADVADLDFDGDARAAALDLALADPRFAPDVLEAAARRVVEAWAEAVDGSDTALEAVASRHAADELLHPGDPARKTRLVIRGPRVRRIRIAELDAAAEPATMTLELELAGRRYLEDRDTAAVVSGSRSATTSFRERWRLALDGPDSQPWRLADASAVAGAAQPGGRA